jgi:hypothetical protein
MLYMYHNGESCSAVKAHKPQTAKTQMMERKEWVMERERDR